MYVVLADMKFGVVFLNSVEENKGVNKDTEGGFHVFDEAFIKKMVREM